MDSHPADGGACHREGSRGALARGLWSLFEGTAAGCILGLRYTIQEVAVTASSLPGASCAATRGACTRPVLPLVPLYWENKVPTKVLRNRTVKSSYPRGRRVRPSVAASQTKILDCKKQFCLKLMHPEHK